MARKVKFPKYLFVTHNQFSDKSGDWLSAHRDQIAAVEDEDKTSDQVACYILAKVNRLEVVKTVRFVSSEKKKATKEEHGKSKARRTTRP